MSTLRNTISFVFMMLLANNAQAVSVTYANLQSIYGINAVVDTYHGATGEYFHGADASKIMNPNSQLTDAGDSAHATYALEANTDASSYVDLGFSSSIYNGPDYDLVFFFFGGLNEDLVTTSNEFSLDIDMGGALTPITYNSGEAACFGNPEQCIEVTSPFDGTLALTLQYVDLNDFGLSHGDAVDDFRAFLGSESGAALSAIGAIYNEPLVIPLPLPAILFSSGLALLGFVGRRNKNRV